MLICYTQEAKVSEAVWVDGISDYVEQVVHSVAGIAADGVEFDVGYFLRYLFPEVVKKHAPATFVDSNAVDHDLAFNDRLVCSFVVLPLVAATRSHLFAQINLNYILFISHHPLQK